MREADKNPVPDSPLAGLESWLRTLIREEIQAASVSPQANGNHSPTLLTVDELSRDLKVPKSWVYACTRKKKGSIPHLRVGRYPRFELPKVLAWLESKKKD